MTLTIVENRARPRRVLRDYQQAAVARTATALAGGGRAQIHMACGSGKTLVELRAAEKVAPGAALIVVLVPSIALVDQLLKAWRQDAAEEFAALAVCSDEAVADAPVHVADLDATTTTDPGVVAAWLARVSGRRLIVSTYSSAWAVAQALRTGGYRADLLVCDEAHHLTGRLDVAWRQVLDDDFFPAARRLHATATPRFDLRLADPEDIAIAGMDDETLFGPVTANYPLHQAIADHVVKDYRLVVIGVTESEARALLHDPDVDYLEGVASTPLPLLAAQVALARAQARFGLRRVISFHSRVSYAADFARTLPTTVTRLPVDEHARRGTVWSGHVHGEMPTEVRNRVLDHLRHPPEHGWAVVANARCLSEGVDIPAVDGILFASPKRGTVDVVQAIGRAVRRSADISDIATIIVPIVVPDPDDSGEVGALDPGDFRHLWETVTALRAHDEQIAAALDQLRLTVDHPEVGPDLPQRISVVLPPGVADHVLAQINVVLIRATTSSWWEGYGAAARFHAEHGHLRVPAAYRDPHGGRALSSWLSYQRTAARQGLLSAERRALLDELGMVWEFNRPVHAWEDAYAIAAAYHAQHGHLNPPDDHRVGRLNLYSWLVRQRHWHVNGTLPAERVAALDRIGMRWTSTDDPWEIGYEAALTYHTRHGHLRIPASYRHAETDYPLGKWIARQRKNRARLDADKQARLDALGMLWTNYFQERWAEGIESATAYHATHGDLAASKTYVTEDGFQLGAWLGSRRNEQRAGRLTSEKVAALDALGMVWEDSRDLRWNASFAEAVAYHAEHGHLDVPHNHKTPNGFRLGSWVLHQRQLRSGIKPGGISDERIAALDALGIRWHLRRSTGRGERSTRTSSRVGEQLEDGAQSGTSCQLAPHSPNRPRTPGAIRTGRQGLA